MPKKKLGRPPLPKNASKQAWVVCRVLKSESKEIEDAARDTKKDKSEWIREVLLSAARAQKPKPKD